jgi:serpin B
MTVESEISQGSAYEDGVRRLAARWLEVAEPGAGGDFVVSPAGLWLALGTLAAGAAGPTAAELARVLGVSGPAAARAVTGAARALAATGSLAVATGVWSAAPPHEGFRAALPEVGFGPLAGQAEIDAWVRAATGGLIGELPLRITAATRLVLAGALALRARWQTPFPAGDTAPRNFTDAAGTVHRVPTMHRRLPPDEVWTAPGGVTVVELPCEAAPDGSPGARVRLVLGEPGRPATRVLPAAWSPRRQPVDADRVTVAVPRLGLRARTDLTGPLRALGLASALSPGADFSALTDEPLYVDQAVQECLLNVAELGVEAAAATALAMRATAVAQRTLRIAFDRPFGIVLLDGSGEVPLLTAWQAGAPADPGLPAYRLDEDEPAQVRRMTFVPFLPGGGCLAVERPDGSVRLPAGDVAEGEMWLRDTALRVPLESAGYRVQRVRPFGYEPLGRHVFVRVEGDRYEGRRPHADVPWRTGTPQEVADALTDPRERAAVLDAERSRRGETRESYFADSVRQTELHYLREGAGPQEGSGFGAGPEQWRIQRRMVVAGLHRDGTFLDVGCANGLLMESVAAWAAEDGRRIEPYGVDLAPGLVARARRRLPHWADRIAVGNALDWTPPDGRRFTFVHVLVDCVPPALFPDVVRHARQRLVAPGGRLLVSVYQPVGGTAPDAARRLAAAGAAVAGSAQGAGAPGTATTAWCDA